MRVREPKFLSGSARLRTTMPQPPYQQVPKIRPGDRVRYRCEGTYINSDTRGLVQYVEPTGRVWVTRDTTGMDEVFLPTELEVVGLQVLSRSIGDLSKIAGDRLVAGCTGCRHLLEQGRERRCSHPSSPGMQHTGGPRYAVMVRTDGPCGPQAALYEPARCDASSQ